MSERALSVAVACFGAPSEVHDLRRALSRLDFRHAVMPVAAWLDVARERRRETTVLFLGSGTYPRERVVEAARKLETIPSLTLLPHDALQWHPAILNHSVDFAYWPCSDQELALRLERVGHAQCREMAPPVTDSAGKEDDLAHFKRYGLIGASTAFREVLRLITRVARYDAPVLIEGETGTGKELCARAIHYLGTRQGQPFIPVNCGALPDNLVENELFGHEKGAFTDAKQSQVGLVAQAQGGTLFLDEIETLSPKGQVALLRFLEDFEYRPLGGKGLRKADVRLIVAGNTELTLLVERGEFRRDLFYRLNVVTIDIPPLRERKDDIKLLAEAFVSQASVRYRLPLKALDLSSLAWMENHDWPGNVRELENVIHRAYVISDGACIRLAAGDTVRCALASGDEPKNDSVERDFNAAKARVIQEFEQAYLRQLLTETSGNVTVAAKRAGKERRALGKLLKKHGLDRSHYL